MIIRPFFIALTLLALSACDRDTNSDTVERTSDSIESKQAVSGTADSDSIEVGKDYHSLSNPHEISITNVVLDLDVSFERRELSGTATLSVKRNQSTANTLILDTRDLTIHSVTANGAAVDYQLGSVDSYLGAPLSIELPDDTQTVTVAYTTSPEASGLQWLTPAQTAGGEHPFLFSQAQAIHARSFIPLQDSPQVRVTYQATIRTPKELLAVMSASNDPDAERDGVYEFTMPQPVPSYLIAIAVGDLQFKAMGERTGVYAEPALLESAAAEFEDTESMLIATEERYGPYGWDRYDLLILPPSFPFGGMENPRLSFITPTVIAGDKSLVSLIAHELAHSWSGNTVTNATWRDLWLNEGFTTYLTYRIMEIVYGTDRYNMEAVLGFQDLEADVADLDAPDTMLAIDLRGRDPDDVFSNVPYEKGALFLREIERRVGREQFDEFLTNYFQKFAFQSITTDEFIEYLQQTLLKQYPDQLSEERIQQWIFGTGLPDNLPLESSDAFSKVDTARTQWLAGNISAIDISTQSWTVHEWLYFLNNMPNALSQDQLANLDAAFSLTQSKNNEIAHSWLMISVRNWYEPALPRLREYLISIGRNKLVKPLYEALSKTEQGRALAQEAFAQARDGYHPLTVKANLPFIE